MPKAKSSERGYMTKAEVESHLDGLKTNDGKINYLNTILKKKGIFKDPKTQNSVYEVLGGLYEKINWAWQAAESYEKAGMKNKAKKIYIRGADEQTKEAFRPETYGYKKAGLSEKEIFKRAGNILSANKNNSHRNPITCDFTIALCYEKGFGLKHKKTKEVYERLGDQIFNSSSNWSKEQGIECYEKAGLKSKANEVLIKMGEKLAKEGHFGLAAIRFKSAGLKNKAEELEKKEIKARDLRRRLEKLKK